EWAAYFLAAQNETGNPGIAHETSYFVPVKKLSGNLSEYPNSWFRLVNFKGAFSKTTGLKGGCCWLNSHLTFCCNIRIGNVSL
ncbi:MAG: hypothetical protein ACOC11_01020, partial [Prolixibacteraceae bacterium]